MVQMAEMADAQAGDLEDEDRVAVLHHVPTADVGRHVADVDVVYDERVARRPAVGVPAAQYVLDAGIWMVGKMRAVGLVHGRHARQRRVAVDAGIVGGDAHAGGRLDDIGGVAGIGDGDVAVDPHWAGVRLT